MNQQDMEYLAKHLSFWRHLTDAERADAEGCTFAAVYPKGKKLYGGNKECLGLVLVESGQPRAFITSKEGKDISLYRLLSMDVCILSASCMIKNLNFDINIEVEKDSRLFVFPTDCFNRLSNENIAVKNFALELMSARFSEVMWVFDQYVFGTAAGRLARFLLEHSVLEDSDTLRVTHEAIANDLGTAREVITRLLKHFATDNVVSLGRSTIQILDKEKLEELGESQNEV
jgi:CRP/FNR family transcriptional regulator